MSNSSDRREATSEERRRQGQRLERLVREHWDDRRGIRGLSQELGVSRATVYSWFRGLTSPDMATLSRLARLLGSTPSELLVSLEGAGHSPELDARIRTLATEAAREVVDARAPYEDRMLSRAAPSWRGDPAPLDEEEDLDLGLSMPRLAAAMESRAFLSVPSMPSAHTVADAIGPQQMASCGADDPVGPVRDRLYAHDFSQMPVRDRDRWIGLITLETIARWMAARAQRGLGFDDQTAVREVLPYAEEPEAFAFVSARATTRHALSFFDRAAEQGAPLIAILVTADGRPTGDLVGIVTASDLPKLRARRP
jgi:transcriptional regulator with XRE-family HTH domain/predicted transcriptional regulator